MDDVQPIARATEGPEVDERLKREPHSFQGSELLVETEAEDVADAPPARGIASSRWESVAERVRDLEKDADVVVMSAPPMLETGATVIASQATDAWIVTARLGETRKNDWSTLRFELANLGRKPAGLIVLLRRSGRHRWPRRALR